MEHSKLKVLTPEFNLTNGSFGLVEHSKLQVLTLTHYLV